MKTENNLNQQILQKEPVKTEASENHYDVIVIGAGAGGLTAAALLCKAGKKVLVVEKEVKPGGLVAPLIAMKKNVLPALLFLFFSFPLVSQVSWMHISSKSGTIEVPNTGKQQTSCAVADFDNDGINDFCISERTTAPGMVWYRRISGGWKRYVVEASVCYIEAGTTACDVDKDGDLIISEGIDLHDSEIIDLDGDGDLDILGKPYDGDAPRLDIWLQIKH